MTPSITVIIPVYNCEKYVERAIRSVLNQPCAAKTEIIVVNDGSKDHSGEICDRIAAEHNNVRVLHKENGGVSSARNMGIERAEGEYIAFLDSDDWWESDFLDEHIMEKITTGGQTSMSLLSGGSIIIRRWRRYMRSRMKNLFMITRKRNVTTGIPFAATYTRRNSWMLCA